jgi:hypothetical protein
MKIIHAFLITTIFAAASAFAGGQEPPEQNTPYAEILVGYSYLNADLYGLSTTRQSLHGWKLALSTPLKPYFSLDYEVSGNYQEVRVPTNPDFDLPPIYDMIVRDYTIFFGPRISHGPFFAHAMIGGDCLSGRAFDESDTEWSLAGALGGGVQLPMTKLLSFRFSVDYELSKHELFGTPTQQFGWYEFSPSTIQNNLRGTVGVVFNIPRKN